MRIAIICPNHFGGGLNRANYFKGYLQSKNHNIDLITVPENSYLSKLWFYYQGAYGRITNNPCLLIEKISEKLEKRIRNGRYDVVIGVETKYSHVLSKELNCLKLFCCQSLEADERYFSGKYNLEDIHKLRDIELEIMMKSNYVIFPWKISEDYVKKYILNGSNFVTIKACCEPKKKTVSYFFPISIVSVGHLGHYWSNPELVSYLSKISPYTLDIYGNHRPDRKYGLKYKGFAESLDVFYNYQFGLNTVSKDLFRQNHFSSRILSYLAYGLPVLYPEWQKYPNDLKGCIPYNEDNFIDVVEKYSEREQWKKLSEEAAKQGRELDPKITLKPLEKLIER